METDYEIRIPSQVVHNKNLSDSAKLLYGYIDQTRRNNWSLVTNKELAKVMKVGERSIRRWISELKKENFILAEEEIINGVKRRTLYLKFYLSEKERWK